MQIPATEAGRKKFKTLGPGPFSRSDLNGIVDPSQTGEFNFATRLTLPGGQSYWEWMNHAFAVKGKGPVTVRHREELPAEYGATFYVIVEKKQWRR